MKITLLIKIIINKEDKKHLTYLYLFSKFDAKKFIYNYTIKYKK